MPAWYVDVHAYLCTRTDIVHAHVDVHDDRDYPDDDEDGKSAMIRLGAWANIAAGAADDDEDDHDDDNDADDDKLTIVVD